MCLFTVNHTKTPLHFSRWFEHQTNNSLQQHGKTHICLGFETMSLSSYWRINRINQLFTHMKLGRKSAVQRPSINSVGRVQFSHMKLKNDDDVRTMFSIFGPYNTKGMIELYTLLVRSFEYIQKSLIQTRNYKERPMNYE